MKTGPFCTPGSGLPSESSYSFYYGQKNPKYPVKPKHLPYPLNSSMVKCYPYKEPIKSNLFAEIIPCAKTVRLNLCRFYFANSFQSKRRRLRAKACKLFGPKHVQFRPVPKCPNKKKSKRQSRAWKSRNQPCPQPPKVECPKPKC